MAYSLFPAIHNTLFNRYNLDTVYVAFDVRPKNLKETIDGIRSLDVKGYTVTIPHKERVAVFLDEID